MRALNAALIAVFIAIGAVACSSSRQERGTAEPVTPPATTKLDAQLVSEPWAFDGLIMQIDREVLGFGGMTEDAATNTLQVRLTRRDVNMDARRTAIVSYFPQLSDLKIQVVDANFDFVQL